MEGKEVRFGIANTALFATVTTDASCGAVNGWHDSFTPLGGLVPLANILLSEVVFGGVGAGMYGILVYIILSVFIAGLMVGRTPEYLGKKIQAFDVQMAMLTVLIFSLLILTFTAISSVSPGLRHVEHLQPGPARAVRDALRLLVRRRQQRLGVRRHQRQHHWYNTTLGLAMLFGRFFMIIPPLAIAGSLSRKKLIPPSLGTFPVTTPLFTTLLVGVILIVGALTFFPALSLGPIVEHFLMHSGTGLLMATTKRRKTKARSGIPRSSGARSATRSGSSIPRTMMARNPVMFVVEVGSVLTTLQLIRGRRPAGGPSASSCRSRSGSGSRCSSPTSPRRWPRARQGAGRHAAQGQDRDHREARACRRTDARGRARAALRKGDVVSACRPARSSRPTARSSKASPRSTSRRSPASRRRSSASRAAIARR